MFENKPIGTPLSMAYPEKFRPEMKRTSLSHKVMNFATKSFIRLAREKNLPRSQVGRSFEFIELENNVLRG
jgi:hypothetical protein